MRVYICWKDAALEKQLVENLHELPSLCQRVLALDPVIEKMSSYKGDSFSRFAEFRVQKYENKLSQNTGTGVMVLGGEPYDVLINISDINLVYRLRDREGKMYSCMMHVNFQELPILVRQQYKEVIKSIRKAAEMMVK